MRKLASTLILAILCVGVNTDLIPASGKRSAAASEALAAESKPAARPPDAASDARLIDFLMKHFKIPDPKWLHLGPPQPTQIAGLPYVRSLEVTNDQSQHVSTLLFEDATGTHVVLGTYLDLTQEPWQRADMKPVHMDDRPTLGPVGAPITIVEFADFECPFCAHAFTSLETMENNTYKGKVRVIFKNYPLNIHPWAPKAALAGVCVNMQNPQAFWDFARQVYADQSNINPKNVEDKTDEIAKKLGLDVPTLRACEKAPSTAALVAQDQQDGEAVKVNSTPTFFVNGIPVVGLPEGKVFDYIIASELQGKHP